MNKPKKKQICNICNLPGVVTYTDTDKNGRTITKTHEVLCVGHEGVHPSLWNMHPEYTEYQKFLARKHKQSITGQR